MDAAEKINSHWPTDVQRDADRLINQFGADAPLRCAQIVDNVEQDSVLGYWLAVQMEIAKRL
jgi:hypothetical protein